MSSTSVPDRMTAVTVVPDADGGKLALATVAVPRPDAHQVLIRVVAAGLNRADLRRTQVHFKTDGPIIAGLEASGIVLRVGDEVTGFKPGDRVAAMAPSTYAEYAVADEVSTIPLPGGVDVHSAAALPTWYMTAHNALVTAGRFRSGDAVLVTAARSGIGIATCQVAKALGAQTIVGSVRKGGDDKRLLDLGCSAVVGSTPGEIAKDMLAVTGDRGVDVVVDMVGAGILADLLDCAAWGGRIVSVGRLAGFHDTIDLDKLALKRLSLIGVTFRTRSREEKRAVRDAMVSDLWPQLENGTIKPVIDRTFPLAEAVEAQTYMAANRHFGKVVLAVADP